MSSLRQNLHFSSFLTISFLATKNFVSKLSIIVLHCLITIIPLNLPHFIIKHMLVARAPLPLLLFPMVHALLLFLSFQDDYLRDPSESSSELFDKTLSKSHSMQQWAPLPHDDSESDDSDDAVGGFGIPQAGLVHPILPFYQSWIRFFTSTLALTFSILNLMKKLSRTLPIFGAIGSAQ